MRAFAYVVATFVLLAAVSAFAHGPQIQVTNDGGKIVTRQLIADGPYSTCAFGGDVGICDAAARLQRCFVFAAEQRDRSDFGGAGVSVGAWLCVWIRSGRRRPAVVRGRQCSFAGFTDGLKRWNGTSFRRCRGDAIEGVPRIECEYRESGRELCDNLGQRAV